MYWTMLRRELLGRKRQTIIVSIGLAIAIALVIVVSSLSTGIKNAQAQALEGVYGVGTDLTVTGSPAEPGGQGGPRFEFDADAGESDGDTTRLAQSQLMTEPMRGTLEASVVDTISGLDGVESASGTLSLTNTSFTGEMPDFSQQEGGMGGDPGEMGGMQGGPGGGSSFGIDSFSVLGVDPATTSTGPLSATAIADGRELTASDSGELVALVDSSYASTESLAVGDSLEVGGSEVEIVGIVESASEEADTAANIYLPLETAQSLANAEGAISTVYVSAASANDIAALQSKIEEALPDTTVSSQADLAAQVSGSLSSASSLISSLGTWLSVIVLAVALAIAALLTSSGVTRRTREFGTLKAVGWSNGRVVGQLAGESLVQAFIGGVLGLVLGLGAVGVINLISPTIGGSTGTGSAQGGPGEMSGGMPGGMGQMPDFENMPGGGAGGPGGFGQSLASSAEIVLHAPITPWVVLAAIGLSLLGGLVAGSFASWRAARLSPSAALRAVA